MKYFLYTLVLLLSIFGCSKESGSEIDTSLYELSSDISIVEMHNDLSSIAVTTKNSIVLKLEGVESHENDTNGVGTDSIVFYVDENETRTFCLEDVQNRGHKISLKNSSYKLLFSITEGCKSLDLEKGYYKLLVDNADTNAGIAHTVFLTSTVENDPQYTHMLSTSNSSAKQAVTLGDLQKKTILSFNVCKNCNLQNLKLNNLAFDSVFAENYLAPKLKAPYFDILGTTEEEFFSIQNTNPNYSKNILDLSGSSLHGADLSYSVFRGTIFNGVDFGDANLSHAVFTDCSFDGANFDNVDMEKALFLNPNFGKESSIKQSVISRASVTQTRLYVTNLFGGYESEYMTAFLTHDNLMVLYNLAPSKGRELFYKSAPKGLRFISPPSIARLNNHLDYSSFARFDNGYVYGYCSQTKKWENLQNSKKCDSSPVALSWSEKKEISTKLMVTCHNKKGTLYSWDRTTTGSDNPDAWNEKSYTIDSVEGDIAVNAQGGIAYIKDNKLYVKYLDDLPRSDSGSVNDNSFSPEDITGNPSDYFLSQPDLQLFTQQVTVVMSDGNLYIGDTKGAFKNLGHPDKGILSAPSFAKVEYADSNYQEKLLLIDGEGEIYYNDFNIENFPWSPYKINSTIEKTVTTHDLEFKNNTLNYTYFEDAKLDYMPLSSNDMTNVVFHSSSLGSSDFKGMDLNETYFYNSSFDSADFSGATISGATWDGNGFFHCNFSNVDFLLKDYRVINNAFKYNYYELVAQFTNAKNIPVKLFYPYASTPPVDAIILENYDFTGASFNGLESLNFKDIFLTNLKLSKANISDIDATGSTWEGCDLSYATIKNATFDQASLNSLSFYQANIENSSFVGSSWNDVNASYGHFQDSTMTKLDVAKSNLSHASFANSDLSSAEFDKDVKAQNSSFNGATLQGVKFVDIDFSSADFTSANFDSLYDWDTLTQVDSDLSGSNLTGTHFDNATLRCANMNTTQLNKASFNDANLSGTDMSSLPTVENGYFHAADFSGANFQNTNFGNSDLTDAIFDFSGKMIEFGNGLSCDGHYTQPETSSSTICQDGKQPETKCTFQ